MTKSKFIYLSKPFGAWQVLIFDNKLRKRKRKMKRAIDSRIENYRWVK